MEVNLSRNSISSSQQNATNSAGRSVKEGGKVAWIIATASLAFVVVQLDVTIVNVALPNISASLAAAVTALQWVVDAYTLGFATLLLSAGAATDRFGSKHVFIAGFVGFAAASLACGLAPNSTFLNAARALQGIGAAMLVPSSLAVLNTACAHDSRLRARAVGIWTAAGGISIAAGPVLGGLMLTAFGWRSIFLVNLPVCLLGIGLIWRFVPEFPQTRQSRSFDFGGQLLVILSLSGLIGAVIEVRSLGLAHPLVYGGIILALVAGAMFMAIETWAKTPMIPLSLFRRRGFGPAILFGALVNLSYYGVIFVLSLYLQKALGYSARQAGLAFIPLTATFILSNMASGWMTGRTGPRFPMVLGGLIGAFGYALLSPLGAQATFLNMLPGFVLIPFGIGLGVPAMTTAILSSVDSSWAGTVSALLNAARQTGGAIGVAVFGALLGGDLPDQIIAGLTTVTWSAAVLAGAAALIAFRIPPSVQAGNEEVVGSQCQ